MPSINQYNKTLRYYINKGMRLAFKRHGVNRVPTKDEIETILLKVKQKIWENPDIVPKVKDYGYRAGRNGAINIIKRGALRENYQLNNFNHKDSKKALIESLLKYLIKEWNINKPFTIDFIDDKINEQNDLAKTGHYDPSSSKISIYTSGRHYKDVLRTVAHEVFHHKQFCEGKLDKLMESELDQKSIYDDIEEDAYRFGNKTFRIWEDKYKNGALNRMSKKSIETLKEELIKKISEGLVVEASEKDTPTRSTGINKLITALKVILPTVESAYKSLTTDKVQRDSFKKAYLMALLSTLAPQNVIAKYTDGSDSETTPIKMNESLRLKLNNLFNDEDKVIEDTPEDTESEQAVEDIGGQKFVKDPSKLIDPNDPDGKKKQKEEEKAAKKGKKSAVEDEAEKILSIDDQEIPFPEEKGMDPTGRFEAVEVYKKTSDAVIRTFRKLANDKDKTDFQNELITQLLLWFDKWEYDISPDVPDLSTDEYEQTKGQVKGYQQGQNASADASAMPSLAESVKSVKPKSFDDEILEALKAKNII